LRASKKNDIAKIGTVQSISTVIFSLYCACSHVCLYLNYCVCKTVEVQQRALFLAELKSLGSCSGSVGAPPASHQLSTREVDSLLEKFEDSSMRKDTLSGIIDASLSTFLLHVESRVASSQGLGECVSGARITSIHST
jgi:hypothetical protein